jgi:hypothetical protein
MSEYSLASPTFPILVWMLTATTDGERIYITISLVVLYLVFAFLIIYAICLPLAWPRQNRRSLRRHLSIADYASIFYASNLLNDPESKLDISAPNATRRHLVPRIFLEEKTYQVGLYNGVDGKCHFGLDVAELGESGNRKPCAVLAL